MECISLNCLTLKLIKYNVYNYHNIAKHGLFGDTSAAGVIHRKLNFYSEYRGAEAYVTVKPWSLFSPIRVDIVLVIGFISLNFLDYLPPNCNFIYTRYKSCKKTKQNGPF